MRGLGNKRTLITGGVYALTNEDGGAIPGDFYAFDFVGEFSCQVVCLCCSF